MCIDEVRWHYGLNDFKTAKYYPGYFADFSAASPFINHLLTWIAVGKQRIRKVRISRVISGLCSNYDNFCLCVFFPACVFIQHFPDAHLGLFINPRTGGVMNDRQLTGAMMKSTKRYLPNMFEAEAVPQDKGRQCRGVGHLIMRRLCVTHLRVLSIADQVAAAALGVIQGTVTESPHHAAAALHSVKERTMVRTLVPYNHHAT